MVDHGSARTYQSGLRAGGAWVIALTVAVVAVALLATGCGGGKKTTGNAPTGKFTLSAAIPVAQQAILATGGKITVGTGGGPLAGMTLDVPKDAFAVPREFRISYLPISKHTFGKDVSPVSPMIDIEYGGGMAEVPFLVTVPMKSEPGHVALPYYYDDQTGTLEALPILRRTADTVTVQTAHFSRWFFTDALESVLLDTKADSGFLPSKDQWQFPNEGSYVSSGGICSGMTLSSLYYWVNRRPVDGKRLTWLYDRNRDEPATPKFWRDDSLGYRLASTVQVDNEALWDSSFEGILEGPAMEASMSDDRITFEVIAQGIRLTGRPQLIGIRGQDPLTGRWYGHSVIGYRVENQTIYIADPNWFDDDKRTIRLRDGKFETYYGGETSATATDPYTVVRPRGLTALANWSVVGQRWTEFDEKKVGAAKFPVIPLSVVQKDAKGVDQYIPLVDRLTVNTSPLRVIVGDGKQAPTDSYFGIFRSDGKRDLDANGTGLWFDHSFALFPGPNQLGVYYAAVPRGEKQAQYVDFQWITINYSSIEITATPNPAPPGTAVAFTATMKDAPSTARWDWDFGDGTKAANGGATQSHPYKQEGSYTVKLTVSDAAGKQPVEVGTSQTTVTIRNARTQTLREILASVGFSGAATDRYGTCTDTSCTRMVTYANRLNTTLAIERKPSAPSGYLNGLLTTAPSITRLEYPPSPPSPLLPTPTPIGATPTPAPTPTQITTKATTDRAQYRGLDAAHWTLVTAGSADSMLAVAKDNFLITVRVSWSCQWTQAQVAAGEATCSNPGVPSSPTALMDAVIAALAP